MPVRRPSNEKPPAFGWRDARGMIDLFRQVGRRRHVSDARECVSKSLNFKRPFCWLQTIESRRLSREVAQP